MDVNIFSWTMYFFVFRSFVGSHLFYSLFNKGNDFSQSKESNLKQFRSCNVNYSPVINFNAFLMFINV